MDFLLDEGAGAKKVKNLLRKKGHNVKAANEGKLRGIKDPPLLKIAIEENRFVVTFDKLFETNYKGKQYGVILIQGDHIMTQKLAERLVWTIEYICQKSEILIGITTVLELPTPYGS